MGVFRFESFSYFTCPFTLFDPKDEYRVKLILKIPSPRITYKR